MGIHQANYKVDGSGRKGRVVMIHTEVTIWRKEWKMKMLVCSGAAEIPAQLERPRTFLRWKAFWYWLCTCPALSWRHGEHLAGRTRALLVNLGVWGPNGALRWPRGLLL